MLSKLPQIIGVLSHTINTFLLFLFQDPAALKNLRRLSITNNLEILRDRLLREMARKNTNTNAQVINITISFCVFE